MSLATQTMVEQSQPAPRRSQRERKQVQPIVVQGSVSPNKRKRDDNGDSELTEESESEAEFVVRRRARQSDEEEDEYVAPKTVVKTGRGRGRPKAISEGAPVSKKPRRNTKPAGEKKQKSTTTPRRPRKKPAAETDPSKIAQETELPDDNTLFNTLLDPDTTLQTTVEDFLESLNDTPHSALADLINCVLRACGSSSSVDSDTVMDYDGVVDMLDDFTEILRAHEAPTYPLTSKLPKYKKFRKSLSEFLERLVTSAAEMLSLYNSELIPILQAWVISMSSSQLRSFRHTATVIALEVQTALCDLAAAVEKEAELIARQRAGEKKRKAAANKETTKGRRKGKNDEIDKEFETKATEVRQRRAKLEEYIQEFFDGVFVHRYRDFDPNIRGECVHALGDWFKKYPSRFLVGTYLRYVGWVLSDRATPVRLEAIRAVVSLYNKEDFIVSLHQFTERFKGRLIQMALRDTELSVRVAVIQVLCSIDRHGLLEEEQRETLCLLVFDEEPKVRKAVSGFVKGIWEEMIEERLVARKKGADKENDRAHAGAKALAMLLVTWTKKLDKTNAVDLDEDEEPGAAGDSAMSDGGLGTSTVRYKEVSALVNPQQQGRIALVVDALWSEVEAATEWQTLLELLLMDHSAGSVPVNVSTQGGRRKKTVESGTNENGVDEAWRLNEVEEGILLEVLVAVLRKTRAEAANTVKKGEEDAVASEITRELIKSLPGLFTKLQTDENRIADVLLIPELMNLDIYLDMRMISAYEGLWNDVIKQLLTHSSPAVIAHAVAAVKHLLNANSLANTNGTKIVELEEELAQSLRDAVAGRDELEITSFSEDEVRILAAVCARITALMGMRDLTAWMEEDEGGKQSSAWDIIVALAERGRLGYKDEELLVDQALQSLMLHIVWKARNLKSGAIPAATESQFIDTLKEQRDCFVEKLTEFAVGTQSNALNTIKRSAFVNLTTLYILFSPPPSSEPEEVQIDAESDNQLSTLSLKMSDEIQSRCAGFIQAQIEQYADDLGESRPDKDMDSDDDSGQSARETEDPKSTSKGKKKTKKAQQIEDARPSSRSDLEREYVFNTTVSSFLRAIRAGVINVQHSVVPLAYYGRLGASFDLTVKVMVEILREEGMYNGNGHIVADIVTQALRESFSLFLDRVAPSEAHTLTLAKLLNTCLIVRGAQLSILKRLDSSLVVAIHTESISWIVKRIAAYENNFNRRARSHALLFFKALSSLLSAVESKDAHSIKTHLDQTVSQAKLEVSATAAVWEPFRAYERRLSSGIAKEKGKKVRKGMQDVELITTDEEGDDKDKPQAAEDDEDGPVTNGNHVGDTDKRGRGRPRRPKPAYTGADGEAGGTSGEESGLTELSELEEDEEDIEDFPPTQLTGAQTPKGPNGVSGSAMRSRKRNVAEIENENDETPTRPRQRVRALAADETGTIEDLMSVEGYLDEASVLANSQQKSANPSPNRTPIRSQRAFQDPADEPTQASEIVVRKKRVRH